MTELTSPWREIVTFLIGGGVFKGLDWLLAYRRQRAEMQLAHETASGESLERRVTATVRVIDIYQESTDDFAERIRSLRGENRALKGQVKELSRRVEKLSQENELLREMKRLEGRGPLIEPGPPGDQG
ncbi:MAG TPA: hypothetical protein VEB22_06670 [Phycisphaerales bacterium]|nr:hypothetical protein [Phycisphaerales bacterium]